MLLLILWLHIFLMFFSFFLLKHFIYLLLAALGLRCCVGFPLVAPSGGYFLSCSVQASHWGGFSCCWVRALGHAGFSTVLPGLQGTGSTAVAHRLSCSVACGIFLDQGSNPRLPHWQAGSLSLTPEGRPQWDLKWLHGRQEIKLVKIMCSLNSWAKYTSDMAWYFSFPHTTFSHKQETC